MLLLVLLLFPMVLQAQNDCNLEANVIPNIADGVLMSFNPKCHKSTVECSNSIDYKSIISLNISNVGLKSVTADVFDKFDQLSCLNLSNNLLRVLPKLVFSNLKNLKHLNLANNQITNFYNNFVGLNNLDYLDISNNKLKFLKQSCFAEFPQKTIITIKGNKLSKISTLIFQNSRKSYKATAKYNDGRDLLDPRRRRQATSEKTVVEVCFEINESRENLVNRVNILNPNKPSNGCQRVYIDSEILNFENLNIQGFKDNWYRIDDTVHITMVIIAGNPIRRITRTMLKSLPRTVTDLNLESNKLGSIKEELIENMNSLATNISVLMLKNNGLKSTKIVANFPSNLTELNLKDNEITEITEGSFSNFKRLSKLYLGNNNLTELRSKDLQGLSSLKYLDLTNNVLERIEPDSFFNLQNLSELYLSGNKLYSFSKNTFRGLDSIKFIDLSSNSLRIINEDTFFNMSDTLSKILLRNNKIQVLGVNSFVKVPKVELDLSNNKISCIEMYAFDLSTLENLNLDFNNLNELNGDSFMGLPNLKKLSLSRNGIEKINLDFWEYLDNVKNLDISYNLIKLLDNGDLWGMTKREEGFVIVDNTPIEKIHGSVFSSFPMMTLDDDDSFDIDYMSQGEKCVVTGSLMPMMGTQGGVFSRHPITTHENGDFSGMSTEGKRVVTDSEMPMKKTQGGVFSRPPITTVSTMPIETTQNNVPSRSKNSAYSFTLERILYFIILGLVVLFY